MRIILLLAFILAFAETAHAQVKTNLNNREQITTRGRFSKNFIGKATHVIPARNIKALLEKEEHESTSGEAKPFRIAESVRVDIDVAKEAEWVEEGEFAYGKFSIEADIAKSISANFDRFYLTVCVQRKRRNHSGNPLSSHL